MNLVFLGAPGAGKGTQATRVCEKYRIPHISTGDILRANIQAGTPLGVQAKSLIDRGMLVPVEVVVVLMRDRLAQADCAHGYLLDGFPRTLEQARALAQFAQIDLAIDIAVDPEMVVDRIAGRRMCRCGESYHISMHPSPICDKCGQQLYQRDDDKPETVKARLEVYREQTEPLIGFYREAGVLRTVNGAQEMDRVFADIVGVLDGQH